MAVARSYTVYKSIFYMYAKAIIDECTRRENQISSYCNGTIIHICVGELFYLCLTCYNLLMKKQDTHLN